MLCTNGHTARTRTLAAVALALIVAAPRAALAQGSLVAWGADTYGVVSNVPAGMFVAVAAGAAHAVAIRDDATLVSWGNDDWSQVSGTPSGTFTAVAAGEYHSVAIRTDGTLVSWGGDDSLGGVVSGTPSGTFVAVAAAAWYSVAIRTDGSLAGWGWDLWSTQPIPMPSGTFSAVAAAPSYRLAIRTDGTLVSVGSTSFVPPAGVFVAVAAGDDHALAIRDDATLVSWGDDTYGQVSVTPSGTFTAVAASHGHSVAIRTDGTLVSWGNDDSGQVSGTPAGTYSAVVASPTGINYFAPFSVAIAGSGNHPPAVTCNDPVVMWSPNHELVDASAAFSVDDPDGDPVDVSIRVFSDETEIPDTGDGTGRHAPDFKTQLASGATGLFLRSERRAPENGRFYIGVITADDGRGGVTRQACILAVCPHDQTQESLDLVLTQAAAALAAVQDDVALGTLPAPPNAPPGLYEHGLSEPLGPNQ